MPLEIHGEYHVFGYANLLLRKVAFPHYDPPIYGDYIKVIMYIYIFGNQKTPLTIIAYGVFFNLVSIEIFIGVYSLG